MKASITSGRKQPQAWTVAGEMGWTMTQAARSMQLVLLRNAEPGSQKMLHAIRWKFLALSKARTSPSPSSTKPPISEST